MKKNTMTMRSTLGRFSLTLVALLYVTSTSWVAAQDAPPPVVPTPSAPASTYTVYLANFSAGRAVFYLSQRRIAFVWDKDVQTVCDLASTSFFAPTTLFPQNACRIFVEITHEWWLSARVYYPCANCAGSEFSHMTLAYTTPKVHLAGLRPGAVYEYDG